MSSGSRVRYIDVAKGIAIICVILGHLSNFQINRVVFTFHLPIFFFITGYFIHPDVPMKKFISKKFRTLIVPYLVTCCAIIILAVLRTLLVGEPSEVIPVAWNWIYASLYGAGDSYTDPFPIQGIGAIWFLLASFWGSISLKCSLHLKRGSRIAVILLLFAVGYWSRTLFWFPFSIQAGCCATLFMYLGYLLNESREYLKLIPIETKIVVFILALGTWICFVRDFQSFWLVHCDVGRGATDIVGSIAGCYLLLLLSQYIDKKWGCLAKPLAFLGEYSIFILCAHIVELNLFPWGHVTAFILNHGLPQATCLPIIIIGKFLWSIPLTIIGAKWNITRRLWGFPVIKK